MDYQEAIEMFKRDGAALAKRGHWNMAERYQCAIDAMKELQLYKELGTLEEAKKAVNKSKPQKVTHPGCYDSNGVYHTWNGISGVPYDLCPTCGINLCTDGYFGRDKNSLKFCENCGQALDWSEKKCHTKSKL